MTVRFYATLRRIVGAKAVDVGDVVGLTVEDLAKHVVGLYPDLAELVLDDDGGLARHVHVFVDGRSAVWLPDGTKTVVRSEHTIEFFPAVAGG